MTRIVIAGGPRVGKTELSERLSSGVSVLHTDTLIGRMTDRQAVDRVADWLSLPGPYVIEGVTAVRALRQWLATHTEGMPCDLVLWSETPKVAQTKGQRTMAKGCRTVWTQIESEIRARGVSVQRF